MGEGASIVNCDSVTGLFGSSKLIDYATAKDAVHAFTKALAADLSPAFVFLASPVTAGYVNGIVLPVMGGPKG